ncbi:hypothetical protein [Desulfovibrio piger]|uniref:hypothetical protein n=1 Tax=Desulfovibrio piger TaxID=901 RepID=UPI0026E96C22|nr:hypothetical protein [Desulfovibrio piger]
MAFDIQSFYNDVYGYNTDSGVTTPTKAVSVFDAGYISSSKSASLTKSRTGYFALGATAFGGASGSTDGGQADTTQASTANFWQIIITSITEGHNVSVFAAGALPVQVNITGMLLRTASNNHHFEFLKRYVDGLRARKLSVEERTCTFVSKDTSFKIIIEALVIESSVENETYVNISIQGHAYGYKMANSRDHLQLGYYGTASPVATSAAKKNEQEQNGLEQGEQAGEEQRSSSDPETSLKPVGDNNPTSTKPRETIMV